MSKRSEVKLRIGIDFGGVCTYDDGKYEDGKADEDERINMPGCIEALQELKKDGHHLVLISYCGIKRAERMGISKVKEYFNEIYLVTKRQYKAQVCQSLGIDLMIDDRLDVLKEIGEKTHTRTVKFKYHRIDKKVGYLPDQYVVGWVGRNSVLAVVDRMVTYGLIVRPIPQPINLSPFLHPIQGMIMK